MTETAERQRIRQLTRARKVAAANRVRQASVDARARERGRKRMRAAAARLERAKLTGTGVEAATAAYWQALSTWLTAWGFKGRP